MKKILFLLSAVAILAVVPGCNWKFWEKGHKEAHHEAAMPAAEHHEAVKPAVEHHEAAMPAAHEAAHAAK